MNKTLIFSINPLSDIATNLINMNEFRKGVFDDSVFANSEIRLKVDNVDEKDNVVVVLDGIKNIHENIIKAILLIDSISRFNPKEITCIIPWLYYSPQDKVFRAGEALSSKVIITLLESAKIDRFITFDLHSNLNKSFLTKPVTELTAVKLFADKFYNIVDESFVVVSFDKGSLPRSERFAKLLGLPLVKFDKERDRITGEVTFKKLYGDVKNKNTISFDDFVGTGGTRILGSQILKENGAIKHIDCVTHAIVEKTLDLIEGCTTISEFYISNTTNIKLKKDYKKIKQIDVTPSIVDELNKLT